MFQLSSLDEPPPCVLSGLLIMELQNLLSVKAKMHALAEISTAFSDYSTADLLLNFTLGAALTRKFLKHVGKRPERTHSTGGKEKMRCGRYVQGCSGYLNLPASTSHRRRSNC